MARGSIEQPTPAVPVNVRFGPGGGLYEIVMTGKDTGGRFFGFIAIEPPGGGPPLHAHDSEDELFVVLEGEFTFAIGGHVTKVGPGGSAFAARGVAHCFKNCSKDRARMLVAFTPGSIEGFFDYGLPVNGTAPSDEHLIQRIGELGPQYGLTLLGPAPL